LASKAYPFVTSPNAMAGLCLCGITTQSPGWMSKTNGAIWLAQLIRVLGFSSG
jgi:hypothetical protein